MSANKVNIINGIYELYWFSHVIFININTSLVIYMYVAELFTKGIAIGG